MSKRTYIILAICLLIIAGSIGAYWYLRKKQKASDAGADQTLPSAGDQRADSDPVLKMGSRGENVKKLQQFLHEKLVLAPIYDKPNPVCNGKTLDSLVIDGIFGEKTECACQWWYGKTSVKLSEIPDGTLS